MNEFQILSKFLEKKQLAQELEIKINISANDKEKKRFENDLNDINSEIEKLQNQLIETPDKSFSRKAKQAMVKQLEKYVEEISKARPGLDLSRNQGLLLENELFSGLVNDLKHLIINEPFFIRIPAYLKYTKDPSDSVNTTEFISFIRNEIELLGNLNTFNYLDLIEYKEQLIERIRAHFL